jgi:prepilin-type N-terminal cleavage/methylation domain-containing protein
MRTAPADSLIRSHARGFTLVELMVAMAIGLGLAGTVVLLLVQAATEQRHGFSDTTVEEKAYVLQASLAGCLRSMSASMGFSPNYSSSCYDTNGNFLGYKSIFVFSPSNGVYTTASIAYNSTNGQVVYTPNVSVPTTQITWISNTATVDLTEFYFTTSFNPDGSQNNSLVNVAFQMNDNGFSRQGLINNPTSIFRNFSMQMRNDN